MKKYDLHWVDLEPAKGAMMKKTRPAVIVSPSSLNKYLGTIVVCPLTSRIHERWPSRIQIEVDGKMGEIAIDQIRTVPKENLGDKIRSLAAKEKKLLDETLTYFFQQD